MKLTPKIFFLLSNLIQLNQASDHAPYPKTESGVFYSLEFKTLVSESGKSFIFYKIDYLSEKLLKIWEPDATTLHENAMRLMDRINTYTINKYKSQKAAALSKEFQIANELLGLALQLHPTTFDPSLRKRPDQMVDTYTKALELKAELEEIIKESEKPKIKKGPQRLLAQH